MSHEKLWDLFGPDDAPASHLQDVKAHVRHHLIKLWKEGDEWNEVRDNWHVKDFDARMERLRTHVQSIEHMKAVSPAVRAHLGLPCIVQMERDVWRGVVAPEFFHSFRRDVERFWLCQKHDSSSRWGLVQEHTLHLDISIFRWFAKKILEHIGEDMGYTMEVRDLRTALVRTGYGGERMRMYLGSMARAMDVYATLWVESHGDGYVKTPDGHEIDGLKILMTKAELRELRDNEPAFFDDEGSDEEGD